MVFWFLTKSIKNFEKTKTKKTKLQTLIHQLVPTWVLQFCFFWFVVFSRGFLEVLTKSIKTLEKPTNTKTNTKLQTLTYQLTYMGLAISFLFFFVFSMVFLILTKSINEKTKKNKIADPDSPACTYMGLSFFVFWFSQCFFDF